MSRVQNPSETLFEEYLATTGITAEYEPVFPGVSRRPDYRLCDPWNHVLCEVKEFQAAEREDDLPRFGSIDPYAPIRDKIAEAKIKFREFRDQGYCCVLVLRNEGRLLVDLEPQIVLGAMFGNLGITIPVGPDGPADEALPAFLSGASLHRSKNTTISAVVTLHRVVVGGKEIAALTNHRLQAEGGEIDVRRFMKTYAELERTGPVRYETHTRVVVCDNPYAAVPMPSSLFSGPFDERYGVDDEGYVVRTYAGARVAELG